MKSYLGLLAGLILATGGPLAAQESFIRGDANSDGVVTIADAHFAMNHMFRGNVTPPCRDADDVDDSGQINLTDVITLLSSQYLGGDPPAPPYPGAGPDPTTDDDPLDCQAYGQGAPLEDPAAKLSLQDVTAPGGTRNARITVAVSSSTTLGAFTARIHDVQGVIDQVFYTAERAAENRYFQPLFQVNELKEGRIDLAFLLEYRNKQGIPAGQDVPVMDIAFCLKAGTPAGSYPLVVESAELVDFASGRSISPALDDGTITVLSEIPFVECVFPGDEPPVNATFKLDGASGAPGMRITVPFTVRANRESQGFSYSIDFNEEVLVALPAEKLFQRPGDTPYDFERFDFNNENLRPGSGGIDEGYLAGAALISFTDDGSVLPPEQEVRVLNFPFQIAPLAPAGRTEVRFLNGAQGSRGTVRNALFAGGAEVTPDQAGSFVFINAVVNVISDVTIFVRGDSDGSGRVDISDPQHTLSFLFLGGDPPSCLDAADSNDSGKVDVTDPIATLTFLFLEPGSLPPPHGSAGRDPTFDTLGCASLTP